MLKLLVLYHYYHPDDVISALQFTGLAEGLSERGYEVEVWPSNRSCFGSNTYSSKVEIVKGVKVQRVWRPAFSQHSFLGRILNSIWMQKAWWLRLLFTPSLKPEVILIGTDPLLWALF